MDRLTRFPSLLQSDRVPPVNRGKKGINKGGLNTGDMHQWGGGAFVLMNRVGDSLKYPCSKLWFGVTSVVGDDVTDDSAGHYHMVPIIMLSPILKKW